MICLDSLPHLPGCYLFKDSRDVVIYVGKARDLKKRVSTYFQKQDQGPRTGALVAAASGLDFIVTNTELEALLLENTLVKKHQPRYNIKLKDSSRYAGIELTDEDFPRLRISRRRGARGSFFGPFVSSRERTFVFQTVRKTFGLATCKRFPRRPCLRYHLSHCSGPCMGHISQAEYRARASRAASALAGKTDELLTSLQEEMAILSARQEFEMAMQLRDEIRALQHLQERQQVERSRSYDQDVISYEVEGSSVYLMLFRVYRGTLEGKEDYVFSNSDSFLEEFLVQYYSEREPPEELILEHPLEQSLVDFLTHRRGKKVKATVPRQGEKKMLLDLARKNLEAGFFGDREKLSALQQALRLKKSPQVIECFDISHLAGTFSVGSMVQFRGGRPDRGQYRRFRIKSVSGIDDFASLAETVRRRYSRLKEEKQDMPDLIVIDGGKGQLSAALSELHALRLKIPIVSLAKREEEVYMPGLDGPLEIKKEEKASLYLQEIRDEAHRFALAYNRLLRKKAISD